MKNRTKRLVSLLVVVLTLSLAAPITAQAAFSDVSPDAWYAGDVEDVQRYGIIQGVGNGRFNPSGNLTLAEAITLTARTFAYSNGETIPAGEDSSPWYQSYVRYAGEKGICGPGEFGTAYNGSCDRLTMARLFARVLPADTALTRNTVSDLPDVPNTPENRSVYYLYEQGVLTGNDSRGTFRPDSDVTRAETAAILNRVLDPDKRKTFTLDPAPSVTSSSSFEVYYIDVGQADAALVRCDGKSMLIDGGNAEDSNLIYTFLQKHDVTYLDYIVCTHAHEDHVGGLPGALNFARVGTAYAPVTSYSTKAFGNFVKYLGNQGVTITVPSAGDTFSLGSATAQILGPIQPSDDPNNTSIVIRMVYGSTSFLFTGDAEREEEQDILNAGFPLASTVLKVGHHGSDTSTSYPFLREVMPRYAVISVGTGNSYGHPRDTTLSKLRDAGVKVYRTDMQGDIHCVSDGTTVTFTTARNADADTVGGQGQSGSSSTQYAGEQTYVLNTNTHVFHLPSCGSVSKMSERNKKIVTATREGLLAEGYSPCGSCKP